MVASFRYPPPILDAEPHPVSADSRNGHGQDGDAVAVKQRVQQHQESLFRQPLWLIEDEATSPARRPNGKLL